MAKVVKLSKYAAKKGAKSAKSAGKTAYIRRSQARTST